MPDGLVTEYVEQPQELMLPTGSADGAGQGTADAADAQARVASASASTVAAIDSTSQSL